MAAKYYTLDYRKQNRMRKDVVMPVIVINYNLSMGRGDTADRDEK